MTTPLLLTFTAICLMLLLQGLFRRGAIYEYPFLAGSVFLGFMLPQFIGLSRDPFLPSGGLEAALVMATLCAAMCWAGNVCANHPRPARLWVFDDRRLLIASGTLSLLGAYFYYKITQLPEEMVNHQWTGLPVAYLFFARMMTYGFAIAVLLVARNGSRVAMMIAGFGLLFYLDRVILAGRRQDTVELATIFLMAFWFQRNWILPRSLMVAGLLFGALFINSVGDYRAAAGGEAGPDWKQMANIDFVGNLKRLSEQGGAEVTNAVYTIAAVRRAGTFDFGMYYWNALIFSYVPAQIVGADVKNELYSPLEDPAFQQFLFTPVLGSTSTGISDAFRSFWFFGCLEFFAIAYAMQTLYRLARNGSLMCQLLYMLLPVQAMQSITHDTFHFILPWIHIGIFLLPAMLLARQRGADRRVPPDEGLSRTSLSSARIRPI